jgi:hypothetical protein
MTWTRTNRVTMPDPRRARLTTGGRVNAAALQRLEQDPGSLQMKSRRPFLYRGREAAPDASGTTRPAPLRCTPSRTAATRWSRRSCRQAAGWKVDVRWWLA